MKTTNKWQVKINTEGVKMGAVKYKTREIKCKKCGGMTKGHGVLNTGLKVGPKIYCQLCVIEETTKAFKKTDGDFISWPDAFDKFGYEDGDGDVWTDTVAEFLIELGYTPEQNTWGMHNLIITKLADKKGKVIIHGDTTLDHFIVGYDNPRSYLPKLLVDKLDSRFGKVGGMWGL